MTRSKPLSQPHPLDGVFVPGRKGAALQQSFSEKSLKIGTKLPTDAGSAWSGRPGNTNALYKAFPLSPVGS
jgi:hypothetical protein